MCWSIRSAKCRPIYSPNLKASRAAICHVEIVDPVVEGSVKARMLRRGDTDGRQVLPVQVHGDAAFAAQGVVMETLNLAQTRGYGTHGTVHLIINNQIGFTT